jgi:hypothetical protein
MISKNRKFPCASVFKSPETSVRNGAGINCGEKTNGAVLSESSESLQARKAVLPGGSGTPAHDPKPMKPLPNPAAWKDGVP